MPGSASPAMFRLGRLVGRHRRKSAVALAVLSLSLAYWIVTTVAERRAFAELSSLMAGGDVDRFRSRLAAGRWANARSSDGLTLLHLADDPAIVRALVVAGADVNARTPSGSSPLHLAAYYARAGIVAALLDAGANPGARNDEGDTPLHLLCAWILFEGSLPEIYLPPLNRRTQNGNARQVLHYLLDRGAPIESRNDKGETPAYVAAGRGPGRPELLQDLLARGASTNVRASGGRPMSGDQYSVPSAEVQRVLREHAARTGRN